MPGMENDTNDSLAPVSWRGEQVSRLILGTVQLGMDYGIANKQGRPDPGRAREVVAAAWSAGIRHFDTAQAYGESEAVLGRALAALGLSDEARVVTKLWTRYSALDRASIERSVKESLARLGAPRLWGFLLHHPDALPYWETGLGETLSALRDSGLIAHLGVSLSPPEDAPRCLEHPDMEILQAPANAWDRRLLDGGFFATVREHDRLCCVRSVYLQGLLLMSPDEVAVRLPEAYPAAVQWHACAGRFGMYPLELALRHALRLEVPLVIGAESPGQILETAALAWRGPLPPGIDNEVANALRPCLGAYILEPWQWPTMPNKDR